jgi:hypothetical protein
VKVRFLLQPHVSGIVKRTESTRPEQSAVDVYKKKASCTCFQIISEAEMPIEILEIPLDFIALSVTLVCHGPRLGVSASRL